jgi:transcriptional regulator with XRE-family HTH domain
MDPGNVSRLERGQMAPPESQEVLDRIATALELKRKTAPYQELMDFAAAAKGRIPEDLLDDSEVAARLPILFRTLRSKQISKEQLELLIESIRKG